MLNETNMEKLKASLRGSLLGPGDDSYDAARTVFNAMIDRRPAPIARCTGAADVPADLGQQTNSHSLVLIKLAQTIQCRKGGVHESETTAR
jgi:hypothetical protein